MNQKPKIRIRDFIWIVVVCIAQFVLICSIWIRRTFGVLYSAMTDVYFLNYLQNKRSLFLKYVIIPTFCTFIVLLLLQVIIGRKKDLFGSRKLLLGSMTLLLLSLVGAFCCVDAGPYLARQYRLSKNQWYDTDRFVIHALGRIDGLTYTNSKEALENSYQDGARLLECDFSMTADHQLAACHDWDFWYGWEHDAEDTEEKYVPDLDEFMRTKVMKQFTALSGEDLILFMKDHPDVYIITDTKDTEPETLREPFRAMVELAEKNDCSDVLDRFVVQIYHTYMYEMVQEIYPFSNWIYTLYGERYYGEPDRMEQFANFCMLYDVDVITMGSDVYSDELLEIANRYGLQLFVHTVNKEDLVKAYMEKGVGVYTDETKFCRN